MTFLLGPGNFSGVNSLLNFGRVSYFDSKHEKKNQENRGIYND